MTPSQNPSLVVHEGRTEGLPIVVGCPFPAETAREEVCAAEVSFADGKQVEGQCVALTPPTPQGVRWMELSFLSPCRGEAQVKLRKAQGDKNLHFLARLTKTGVEVSNGKVRVNLNKGAGLAPLTIERFSKADGRWLSLGSLRPELVTEKGMVHHDDPDHRREIKILRNGSIRSQVEIHGQLKLLSGKPSLSYRLTIELWKDIPGIRLDWMLAHLVPGRPDIEVHQATLIGDWQVGNNPIRQFRQLYHGVHGTPYEVHNPSSVSLVADFTCGPIHVTDPAMLLDNTEYFPYRGPILSPTISTDKWLALQGDAASVYLTVADFTASRPNSLVSEGSRLSYQFIPEDHVTRWSQGRRKEQTLLLAVSDHEKKLEPKEAIRCMNALYTPGRAQPTRTMLEQLNCFEMQNTFKYLPGKNIRLNWLMDRLCCLETPGDKWNLGDTTAQYTRGYATYPYRFERLPGAPELPLQFVPNGQSLYPRLSAEFVQPVWANNEYDIIHSLATEIIRTGRNKHFSMLRWTARHTIEVDFIAYSDDKWRHGGQATHSEHHTTRSPLMSHQWAQGLLEYYLLTGDRDALEVAMALGDKVLASHELREGDALPVEPNDRLPFSFSTNRDLGWAILSLVCLVEAGFAKYREYCDKVADFYQSFDYLSYKGVELADKNKSLPRQMVTHAFSYVCLIEAIDRYQKISGRKDIAKWIKTLLHHLRENTWEAVNDRYGSMDIIQVIHMMAIGFERTSDTDFLQAGLAILDSFFDILAMGALERTWGDLWGKNRESAIMYRSLSRFLAHADQAGLLERYELPPLQKKSKEKRKIRSKRFTSGT